MVKFKQPYRIKTKYLKSQIHQKVKVFRIVLLIKHHTLRFHNQSHLREISSLKIASKKYKGYQAFTSASYSTNYIKNLKKIMIQFMMKINQNLSTPNQYTLEIDQELTITNSSIMHRKLTKIGMKHKAMFLWAKTSQSCLNKTPMLLL